MIEQKIEHSSTIRDYLYILFKRKWVIFLCFFIVVTTVTVGTYLTTPLYTAQTKILIEPKQYPTFISNNPFQAEAVKRELVITQAEILKSRNLMEKVAKKLNKNNFKFDELFKSEKILSPEEKTEFLIKYLQSAVNVEVVKDGAFIINIISIEAMATSPELSAKFANLVAETFIEDNLNLKKVEATGAYNFLIDEIKNIKMKLIQSEEALKNFKKNNNVISLNDEAKISLEQLSKQDAEYMNTKLNLEELEMKKKQIREQLAKHNKEIIISTNLVNNPFINDLKKRAFELELQLSDTNARYSINSKEVEELKQKISEVKQMINNTVEKTISTEVTGVNPIYQNLLSDLAKTETEFAIAQVRENVLKKEVEDSNKRISSLPDEEIELARLTREKNSNEAIHNLYLQKMEEIRIAKNISEIENVYVRIIENATPPESPFKPKKFKNIFLGIILGSCLGIGMAFFIEYFDHSLHTSIDIEKYLNIPVLGSISRFKK